MRGMSMDNILGDPFALATISIAIVCDDIPFRIVKENLLEISANQITACMVNCLRWISYRNSFTS